LLRRAAQLAAGALIAGSLGAAAAAPAQAASVQKPAAVTHSSSAVAVRHVLVRPELSSPTITSVASATSNVGAVFNFTVTATGVPLPAITETGSLPSGITFTDNGNGTATITGTPANGTGGSYPITLAATNSSGTASQSFTLTNTQAPTITSVASATFYIAVAGTYTVTTTGYPAPSITEAGTLPSGLAFTAGTGTATISGTSASGTTGTYTVSVSATNSSGSTATLSLTITVVASSSPVITSGSSAYFTLNSAGGVGITTTGSPVPVLTETGALPAGLTFADNGNGTALISGTPTATGTTVITIKATNALGAPTQSYTIYVGTAPAFTSAASATFTHGTSGTFTVTTSGYPAPWIGYTGTLPTGISFVNNGNGTATFSGTPTTTGTYAITLDTDSSYGSATQSFTLTVIQSPTFTSAASTLFYDGVSGTFSVTTAGYPTPALTESGALPSGVTFTDNGNGTATITGTPAAGTAGSYPITITATSTSGTATQSFTLINTQAPTITSPASTTFYVGLSGTYTVTTTGYPAPSITESGTLPSGLAFTAGTGTATISGTPASGTTGTYTVSVSATNSSGSTATLSLTITVATPSSPVITSGSAAYFTLNSAGGAGITTTGSPVPVLTETGALPAGLTFADNGNGTALISGTPTATGTTVITVKATNALGAPTQSYTIYVGTAPAFTSAASATFTHGTSGTFTVTTTGYPAPWIGYTGPLPTGLTFTNNGNGTATITGTPTTAGTYTITLNADSSYGSASQSLTITVQ
jgi:large repetitive protein